VKRRDEIDLRAAVRQHRSLGFVLARFLPGRTEQPR